MQAGGSLDAKRTHSSPKRTHSSPKGTHSNTKRTHSNTREHILTQREPILIHREDIRIHREHILIQRVRAGGGFVGCNDRKSRRCDHSPGARKRGRVHPALHHLDVCNDSVKCRAVFLISGIPKELQCTRSLGSSRGGREREFIRTHCPSGLPDISRRDIKSRRAYSNFVPRGGLVVANTCTHAHTHTHTHTHTRTHARTHARTHGVEGDGGSANVTDVTCHSPVSFCLRYFLYKFNDESRNEESASSESSSNTVYIRCSYDRYTGVEGAVLLSPLGT